MKKLRQAFTLVELIVVITILAILGTIAFISLQGYSKDARDSVRISDISKIKTSLELFQLDSGKYPETTDATNITYSGAIAWTQGIFGENTFKNVEKLDKIPLDPLTDKQYVYSVTNTRQEYQIAGVIEGEVAYNPSPLTPLLWSRGEQVQAADKTAILKISGNYNGKILKVNTGGIDYVLAIPSIITGSGFTVEEIAENNYFAYNGYKNLPSQYFGSSYKVFGEENLNLINKDHLIVYIGDIKILSDQTQEGIDSRKTLIENLQKAYTGTKIINEGQIQTILLTDTTDLIQTEKLSSTIVNNNLGGKSFNNLTITNCSANSNYSYNGHTYSIPEIIHSETSTDIVSSDVLENNGTFKYTLTSVECDNGTLINPIELETPTVSSCNIGYKISGNICIPTQWKDIPGTSCTNSDITIGGKIWAGCNSVLGNGEVYNNNNQCYDYLGLTGGFGCSGDTTKENDYNGYYGEDTIWGKLYLWSTLSTECKNPTGGNFSNITSSTSNCPCPTGRHIPTEQELLNLENSLTCTNSQIDLDFRCSGLGFSGKLSKNSTNNIVRALKIPLAGYKENGSFINRGRHAVFWSSTEYDSNNARGRFLFRYYDGVGRYNRGKTSNYGFSVRCIKD